MDEQGNQYPPGTDPAGRREGIPSKEEIRDTAGAVAGAAREEYEALRGDVREAAQSVKHETLQYAEHQREEVAANVAAIASALQAGVHSLEEQGRHTAASYGRQAAAQVEHLSQWVQGKSLAELWQQAEAYARRQPGVAFGGAVAAGFLLARFLKSSAPPQALPPRSEYAYERPPVTPPAATGYAPQSGFEARTETTGGEGFGPPASTGG